LLTFPHTARGGHVPSGDDRHLTLRSRPRHRKSATWNRFQWNRCQWAFSKESIHSWLFKNGKNIDQSAKSAGENPDSRGASCAQLMATPWNRSPKVAPVPAAARARRPECSAVLGRRERTGHAADRILRAVPGSPRTLLSRVTSRLRFSRRATISAKGPLHFEMIGRDGTRGRGRIIDVANRQNLEAVPDAG